ncbi:VanZ family protein [Paenibacillus xanthanilyticus]|uniref:VanZ family protein n=1 Tax=Paenibacillus xanthanilyticus TaxID=1783531 RepID=A0ABV8K071_9BACL
MENARTVSVVSIGKSAKKLFWFALFLIYGYGLVKVILFKYGTVDAAVLGRQLQLAVDNPEHALHRLSFGNFTPLESITRNLQRLSNRNDAVNLFGNIAIFAPLGAFVGLLTRMKWLGAIVVPFLVSLSLECAQIVFSMGTFDVDDLILNTLGGLLGYAGYRLFTLQH